MHENTPRILVDHNEKGRGDGLEVARWTLTIVSDGIREKSLVIGNKIAQVGL